MAEMDDNDVHLNQYERRVYDDTIDYFYGGGSSSALDIYNSYLDGNLGAVSALKTVARLRHRSIGQIIGALKRRI